MGIERGNRIRTLELSLSIYIYATIENNPSRGFQHFIGTEGQGRGATFMARGKGRRDLVLRRLQQVVLDGLRGLMEVIGLRVDGV